MKNVYYHQPHKYEQKEKKETLGSCFRNSGIPKSGEMKLNFHFPENILDTLVSKDIKLEKEVFFVDVFYDTKDWSLAKNGFWLKKRFINEKENWNLKNTKEQQQWLNIKSTTFQKKTEFLKELHFQGIKRKNLKPFCSISCFRKIFRCDEDVMYLESFYFDEKNNNEFFLLGSFIKKGRVKNSKLFELISDNVLVPYKRKVVEYLSRYEKKVYGELLEASIIGKTRVNVPCNKQPFIYDINKFVIDYIDDEDDDSNSDSDEYETSEEKNDDNDPFKILQKFQKK